MADGFGVRRAIAAEQSGPFPIRHGSFGKVRFGEVLREQFRCCCGGLRELSLQHFGDALVMLLPFAFEQRVVRRVLNQRVFEAVADLRWSAFLEDQLRVQKLAEFFVERLWIERRDGLQQFVRELASERRSQLRDFFRIAQPIEPGHQ